MKILEKSQLAVEIRNDFPILNRRFKRGHKELPLVYFDNAATTQKPYSVIRKISHYYSHYNANVHRALHQLGEEATNEYENAREKTKDFIKARYSDEIIFTRGTTESLNLVAHILGKDINADDKILVSAMEHHSNLLPWQILCEQTGASLDFIPFNEKGELILDDLFKKWDENIKIVSLTHASNVFGTINPVKKLIQKAHNHGSMVIIDGAQSAPHIPIDVQDLDCDFYAVSGHKMCGPTGIGFLYGKKELLKKLPPYQSGGEMIQSVWLEKSIYNEPPYKFEAGTPNICGAIALAEAMDYLNKIGMDKVHDYEQELTYYAIDKLREIAGLKIYGQAEKRTGVISFSMEGIHPHDIAQILDHKGIAIRAGHHCAQPIMRQLKISALARASFYFYNSYKEIDYLVDQLKQVREFFK